MKVTIHQAICGEQNKAWELIRTTLADLGLAKKIAFQTDLQDSPPSGISWLPVIRGFLFGDHFLLLKTYPDNSPDVRNGRVFSHCLIIDKTDLSKISDLSPLLLSFREKPDKAITIEPITVDTNNNRALMKGTLQLRFNKVIQSFIKFTNYQKAIIWVGQNDFEIAVCRLWQMLTQTQREAFTFGINFNPTEVAKDKLSFVVIPDSLENKFENKGFVIVHKEDSAQLKEFSEQFLAGEQNAIDRIQTFVSEIGAVEPAPKDISIIAKGIPTFENLGNEQDLKLLNTLSNIIANYSPKDAQGISIKSILVQKMSLLVEKADDKEIFLLRNFQTESFKESAEKFSNSVSNWCQTHLFKEKKNLSVDYTPFILQVLVLPKNNWLGEVLRENISTFLSNIDPTNAKIVWKWITYDIKVLKHLTSNLQNTKSAEKNLYESLPVLQGGVLSEVKSFAKERNWFGLYATILKSQYDFLTAIKELVGVDSDKDNVDGVNILSEGTKATEIVKAAVSLGDKRLIQMSGKWCRSTPKLLEGMEVENVNWQELWLAAIENGNKVSDGLKDPLKTIQLLFDQLVLGKLVNSYLLSKISESEYGDILKYPNRSRIWNKLPYPAKDRFLEKTSGVFLNALSKNPTLEVPDDKELSDHIVFKGISVFLYYNNNNIKSVLPIFSAYRQLQQHMLNDYVSNYNGNLDVVSATQLGQMVQSKGYENVANTIYHKSYSSKQFRVALAECYNLLDFIPRGIAWAAGWISKAAISEDEWWRAFVELAYTLYPGGPSGSQIWIQAGGKDFDLQTKGTGKEVWIEALQKLRKKDCAGEINTKKLLKVMIEEHKKNESLKTLKRFWTKL